MLLTARFYLCSVPLLLPAPIRPPSCGIGNCGSEDRLPRLIWLSLKPDEGHRLFFLPVAFLAQPLSYPPAFGFESSHFFTPLPFFHSIGAALVTEGT